MSNSWSANNRENNVLKNDDEKWKTKTNVSEKERKKRAQMTQSTAKHEIVEREKEWKLKSRCCCGAVIRHDVDVCSNARCCVYDESIWGISRLICLWRLIELLKCFLASLVTLQIYILSFDRSLALPYCDRSSCQFRNSIHPIIHRSNRCSYVLWRPNHTRAKKSVQILQFGLNDKPLSTIINLALADDLHFSLSLSLECAIALQAIIFTLISMVKRLD